MGIFDILKKGSTPDRDAASHSTGLTGFNSTLYRNAAGLYPQEVLVIQTVPIYRYCVGEDNHKDYWWQNYGVHIDKTLRHLCEKDFLAVGSLEDSLGLYKLPDLKAVLSKYDLKVSGKKDDLIVRLVENVPEAELRRLFPRCPYIVTDAGREAVKEDDYVFYMFRHTIQGLSLYDLNRQLKGKTSRYRDVIWGHYNKRSLELAKEKEWGLYANNRIEMSRFLCEEDKYAEAVTLIVEACCYELCVNPSAFDYIEYLGQNWFPYDKSIITAGHASMLKDFQMKMDMSDDEYNRFITTLVKKTSAPFNVFTASECVDIIISELNDDKPKLRSIYDKAKKRLRKKYPKAKF